MTKNEVVVKGINVRYKSVEKEDYISLTDMAKAKNSKDPRFTVYNWLRNKDTLAYIGLWEELYNPNFNRVEFDTVTKDAGLNSFMITPNTLIEKTGAISLTVSAGRYNSGIFAHKDIAFEFASRLKCIYSII